MRKARRAGVTGGSEPSAPDLHGKALGIYSLLLTSDRPLGIREVQRRLGLSSPSLVLHHIERMHAEDLVRRDEHGNYYVSRKIKSGILGYYYLLGNRLVHRFHLYLVFFTSFLVSVLLLYPLSVDISYILLLIVISSALTIVVYETLRFRLISQDISGGTRDLRRR